MMFKHQLITNSLAAWSCFAAAAAYGSTQQCPNIVLILTDDQGYGDLACYGNADVETPRLDRLAGESVLFRNFHVQPVCSPSRAELMTGRWFLEVGVWGVHGGRDYLDLGARTIAQDLSAAGYATGMMGKWHLGKTSAYMPYSRGFDEAWSISDRLYRHTDPVLNHNGKTEKPKGWTPAILTDLAIEYASRQHDKPFFLYVAYPEVHAPWIAPQKLVDAYLRKGFSQSLATVYAMNEQLDSEVGRLMDSLDGNGLRQNTVVVYLGDNGPIHSSPKLPRLTEDEMARRNPEGLRGVKGQVHENGTRVAGMIRWPRRYEPREVFAAADVVDIYPTLLEIANAKSHGPSQLRGRSLTPLLMGQSDAQPDRPALYANHEAKWSSREGLYSHLPNKALIDLRQTHFALRQADYKLVQINGNRKLFDIIQDPREQIDLTGSEPEIAKRLGCQLDQLVTGIHAEATSYTTPLFPIGYGGETESYAYACAAISISGSVTPDSHSIDDLDKPGDGVTVAIRVDTPGRYRLTLDGDVIGRGGKVTCRVGKSSRTKRLKENAVLGVFPLDSSDEEVEISLLETGDEAAIQSLHGVVFTRISGQ